jgi:hypothetical protein
VKALKQEWNEAETIQSNRMALHLIAVVSSDITFLDDTTNLPCLRYE